MLYKNRAYSNGTHNGVTYTFNGNQCSLSGTASASSFKNIYSSLTNLPTGMKVGDVIHFKYSTSISGVRLCIVFWDANKNVIGGYRYRTIDSDIEIPSDTVGMTIRIDVTSGTETNNTVTFGALLVLSNAELKTYADTLIQAKNAASYASNNSITLSDIKEDGFYVIATNWTVTDAPENLAVTGLTVEHFSVYNANAFVKQTAESLINPSTTKKYYRVSNSNGSSWSDWIEIGGVINNYTINQYANEYNVTATPSITADTNNYLQPTGDQTDMAPAIMAMLTQSGVCNLAPGTFYVSGIDMPIYSIIRGCGTVTNIILLDSVSDGYAIKMWSNCIIEDVKISGGASAPSITSTIGTRHGIIWQGTATPETQTSSGPTRGTISNVHLWFFSGSGLKCYGTGTGISNCLNVVNVYARECTIGVNIEILSEYHRFTNVDCRGCYYGCINNGGNNVFVNCGFSKNIVGLLMDNSNNQSPNNSHGTFSGCIFNHSGSNNDGTAMHIIGCGNGEMFIGCQIFFGATIIENSSGIVFSACNYKGSTYSPITINGGGLVKLVDCVFGTTADITITNNTATVVSGCYLRDGTAVVFN